MRSLVRPDPPADFEAAAPGYLDDLNERMLTALADVPQGKERISRLFEGHEHWGTTKGAFEAARNLPRCGYCERFRDLRGELHVDHFRPKSEVSTWEGEPDEVSDDPPRKIRTGLGYWWCAYRWSNLLLACWTCNAAWKRTLFPLDRATGRPLLLHPFEPFTMRDHFEWDCSGHIRSRSPEAHATIITCGLNRSELVRVRAHVFQAADDAVERYIDARRNGGPDEQKRSERHLRLLGGEDREFTGMVRWIFEDRTSVPAELFFDE